MFDEDVAALYGPEGKHNTGRAGCWHGSEAGSVPLGGRRVPVTRPRARAANGSGELHLSSYDLFSSAKVLGRLAMEKMLAGLSSRRTGPVTVRPARTAGPSHPVPRPGKEAALAQSEPVPPRAHRAAPPPAGNMRTRHYCRKPAQHDQ